MVSVLVVSELRLFRECLVRSLTGDGRLEVLGAVASPVAAPPALRSPDVVLLDLGPHEPNAAIDRAVETFPESRVVGLGISEVESEILRGAEAGLTGYLSREAGLDDVVLTVEAAARDELRCSGRIAGALFRRVGVLASQVGRAAVSSSLTAREQQVLALLSEGCSNQEVARRLFVEVATVKNHVHRVLEKLGVKTRGEAAARARRLDLAIPPSRPS